MQFRNRGSHLVIAGHSSPYRKIPVSVRLPGSDQMVLCHFYGFYVLRLNYLLCSYTSRPLNPCETSIQCTARCKILIQFWIIIRTLCIDISTWPKFHVLPQKEEGLENRIIRIDQSSILSSWCIICRIFSCSNVAPLTWCSIGFNLLHSACNRKQQISAVSFNLRMKTNFFGATLAFPSSKSNEVCLAFLANHS